MTATGAVIADAWTTELMPNFEATSFAVASSAAVLYHTTFAVTLVLPLGFFAATFVYPADLRTEAFVPAKPAVLEDRPL
jgi:hypothetical protein